MRRGGEEENINSNDSEYEYEYVDGYEDSKEPPSARGKLSQDSGEKCHPQMNYQHFSE